MSEYVQKLRAAATLSLPGQEPVDGWFALAPQAEFRLGPETLLERLNTRDRVIPFIRSEDEATCLVARLALEWVKSAHDLEPSLVCPPNYLVTREEWVRVRFQSGDQVEGLLQMELPETLNRATDFLNGPDAFFELCAEDVSWYFNKSRIRVARPLD